MEIFSKHFSSAAWSTILLNFPQSHQMNNIEIQVGSALFRQQIIDGVSEEAIRKTWEPRLSIYKKMRKKYVINKD